MQRIVKLILMVDEETKQELSNYERAMKHEIYKIAGVFKKNKRIFPIRYAAISNQIASHAKEQVRIQAQVYYEDTKKRKHPVLDFSSIWSERSYHLDRNGMLKLIISKEKVITIPFSVSDTQIKRMQNGIYHELTIKQRGEHWFAFLRIEDEKCRLPE